MPPISTQSGDSRRRSSRTVLIADSQPDRLRGLSAHLGDLGHVVLLAENGREALDLIAGHPVDVALVDVSIPGLSAIELLSELRSGPDTSDLPILLLSDTDDDAAAAMALAAGADDYLVRPLNIPKLQARLQREMQRGDRVAALKRRVAALDARIATRAIELGEARHALAVYRSEQLGLRALARVQDGSDALVINPQD